MRLLRFAPLALALFATPAFAQFPPPGIYQCVDAAGKTLGTLSLLVAGDYQWDPANGVSGAGQVSSAGTDTEALSGPLADQHWRGSFSTDGPSTTFTFSTSKGNVACALPPE